MKVKRARRSGFCFGVRRAIEIAESSLRDYAKVYSLGPVIHNRQVVDTLHRQGLVTIDSVGPITNGAVLITSHGSSPDVIRRIRTKGLRVIDTTCPFVSRTQKLVRELTRKKYRLIIVGERSHPEVKSLVGFSSGKADVVNSAKEAKALAVKPREKVCVLSQTTQSLSRYIEIVRIILDKQCRETHIYTTICDDTVIRQKQAEELAGEVDSMIIVGGRNSANTNRLLDISKKCIHDARLVENEDEIKPLWFKGKRSVGVASGASTPDWIIEKVIAKIKQCSFLHCGRKI